MIERYCDVCKQSFNGYTFTIQISDNNERIYITGHEDCINKLHTEINAIKDLHKKPVNKILKEIKFTPNQK
jgi:hypothetical protein